MWQSSIALLALWAGLMPFTMAEDPIYITDMEVFPLLASCAGEALSYAVQLQTMSSCSEGEKELQSCICSNTALSEEVYESLTSGISYTCGDFATEDLVSASKVYDKYCDPDGVKLSFPTPTDNIVNAYITDLREMEYMPPCAQSGLYWGVVGQSSYCPEAASLYAPCVCNKEYVVSMVSETISRSVRSSCSNNQDVTSALNFYHEYCNMNNGTTSFAKPEGPPGDMTYYITGLDLYKSLHTCAQRGVSYAIQGQTDSQCAEGAQELASCVCLKSGMYRSVSSILTSSVKYECDNTATDDLSSAMEVLEYYCSAAESLVVATVTDVAEDAKETSSEASSRTVSASGAPSETGSSGNDDVGSSGGGNGDPNQDGSDDGGDSNSDGSNDNGGISKGALIAIIVLGVIVVLGLIAGIAWFIRRKHTRAKAAAAAAHPPHNPEPYTGMPELLGSDASESRVNIAKSVSPAITDHHPYGRPEMGGTQISELPPQQYRPELHGEAAPQQQQHQGGYAVPYGQPPPPPPQELPSPVAYSPNSPHQQYQQPQYQQPQYQQQYPQQYQPVMGENNRPGEAIAMTPISPPTPSYHQQQNGWQSGPVGPYESHSHAR